MRLLLDTHIALWAVADDERLPPRARDLISDQANDVFVSAASVWEIAIKHALARGGPNDMPVSGADALRYFQDAGYELVDISPTDAAAVETLPMLHADPFDRLLVSQARLERLTLVSADRRFADYDVALLDADT